MKTGVFETGEFVRGTNPAKNNGLFVGLSFEDSEIIILSQKQGMVPQIIYFSVKIFHEHSKHIKGGIRASSGRQNASGYWYSE